MDVLSDKTYLSFITVEFRHVDIELLKRHRSHHSLFFNIAHFTFHEKWLIYVMPKIQIVFEKLNEFY